jgi:hypothetical protein
LEKKSPRYVLKRLTISHSYKTFPNFTIGESKVGLRSPPFLKELNLDCQR